MADYNISANITANTSGFESGVKKAQNSSKKLSKSLTSVIKGFGKSGLTGAITSAGLALGGIGLAVGTAVKAIKGITKALGECAEAYKTQLVAEKALDTAIQNSPYVSGTASKALKDFASQMQKVSNLGDEEIIPQMTQLIATGRTEAEVMKIIKTATDMSASGAMSFDTAVTQLNATLNGNIGRLGQQNAELKGLSEEELKNGIAVDILADKYKGLAEASIDSSKQLKNALGDLKETFGKSFENAMTPMRQFFTEMIQGWADARKAKQEYEGAIIAIEKGEATSNDYRIKEKKLLEEITQIETDLKEQADELGMSYEEAYNSMADWQRYQLEAMKEELANTQMLARMHEGLEKIKKLEGQWAEEEAKKKQEEIEKEKKIADLKTEYLKKIAEQEARWEHIKEVTGEQVSNEEKIKFYQDSLVDLMTQAGGKITTNNQLYKDQKTIIDELAKGIKKQKGELADISRWNDKILQQEKDRLGVANNEAGARGDYNARKKNVTDIYLLTLEQLHKQEEADLKSVEETENAEEAKKKILEYYANEKLSLQRDWNEQLNTINAEENEAEVKAKKEAFIKMMGLAKNYANQIASVFSKMAKTISNVFNEIAGFVKSAFSKMKGVLGKLFKFDTNDALDNLLKFEDSILTFFMETLPKLPQFLASAFQSIEVLVETLKNNIDFDFIFEQFIDVAGNIIKRIPKVMSNIMSLLKRLMNSLGSALKNNTKGILEDVTKMFASFLRSLPTILTNVIGTIGNLINEIINSNLIPTIFNGIGDTICQFLSNTDQINMFIESLIKLIGVLAKNLLSNAGKIFGALIEALPDILMTILVNLPQLLADIIGGAFEGVIAILKGIINVFIKGVNLLIDGLNWADFFDWFPDIPHIPLLAKGTDNAQKGLAIVGEAGPELVNFNGGEQVLSNRKTNQLLAGAGNSNTFNVNFYETKDTTAFAMVNQLKQYNRQMAINGVI
jgi:phage-related protein